MGWPSFAAPIIGSIIGDAWSAHEQAKGQREINDANIALSRDQMAFQERMSNTAHQREVADLRAAGLNPVLSVNSGASTPVGSSAHLENAAPDYRGIGGRAISTALQMAQMKKDFQQADAVIGATKASEELQKRQAEAAKWSARVNETEAKLRDAEFFRSAKENEFLAKNPHYLMLKKYAELISPMVGTARDLAIGYRSLKGFGEEKVETFDDKGTHMGTKIRSRR